MKTHVLLTVTFAFTWIVSSAQKGQIWPTTSRQEFEFDGSGQITQEYEVQSYYSYYLFVSNDEFIHCTSTITSRYKIMSRQEDSNYVDYEVVSEVGNPYSFRFSMNDGYVAIYSTKGFGIYLECLTPYTTKVFN